MKRGRLTIKDVARLAGVSHATVSRVLNKSAKVSPETRDRVLRQVERLKFSRNPSARSLISGRHYTIGLLILYDPFQRQFPTEFLPEVVAGLAPELNHHGYRLTLYLDQLQGETNQIAPELLSHRHVDGLFVLSLERAAEVAYRIAGADVPLIMVNQRIEGLNLSSVVADDVAGACEATSHLLDLGHRRIAFVEGIPHHGSSIDRKAGYRRAFADRGLAPDPGLQGVGMYDQEEGYRAACALLDRRPDVTAIFSANDLMAIGVCRAIKERGLGIPRDVSVVGYDDSQFAAVMDPPLASVRKPRTRMGQSAAALMLELVDGGASSREVKSIVLPTALVTRGSTAAPRSGG